MTMTTLSTLPSTPSNDAPAGASETVSESASETPTTPGSGAAAGGEETAAVVAPQEVSVDPELELSKKFDAIAKREARTRKFEAEWQTKLRTVDETKAKLEAEMQSFLDDPVAYLQAKGKDPVEVVRRVTTPMTEEQKRIRQLEERLAAEDKAREEAAKKEQSTAEQRRQQALFKQFVQEIDPQQYPHIVAVYPDPRELHGAIGRLLNEPYDPTDPRSPTTLEMFQARHGRAPSNAELREALEDQAKRYATTISERIRPPVQAMPSSSVATGISNSHASERATGVTPALRSRKDAVDALKRQLEEG